MENTLNIGEELFKKYNGNFYLMSLDGELDKYRSLDIDSVNEAKWNNDLKNDLVEKLKKEPEINDAFFELCETFLDDADSDLYLKAINIINERKNSLNCVDKLLIAEQIVDVLDTCLTSPNQIKNNITLFKNSFKLANSIIKYLEFSNLQIPNKYLDKPKLISIDKDKIRIRTKDLKSKLETIKNLIHFKSDLERLNFLLEVGELDLTPGEGRVLITPAEIFYKPNKNNSNKPTYFKNPLNIFGEVGKSDLTPIVARVLTTSPEIFYKLNKNNSNKLTKFTVGSKPSDTVTINNCFEFVPDTVSKLNLQEKEDQKLSYKKYIKKITY